MSAIELDLAQRRRLLDVARADDVEERIVEHRLRGAREDDHLRGLFRKEGVKCEEELAAGHAAQGEVADDGVVTVTARDAREGDFGVRHLHGRARALQLLHGADHALQ